jgi:hypothetical protein
MADVNIFDAIPGIEMGVLERDKATLALIFKELTRLTQEHYILGYPYPLAEAHNCKNRGMAHTLNGVCRTP